MCVTQTESFRSPVKQPLLECVQKETERCHLSYGTKFKASQQETCDNVFEKVCQITFRKEANEETVKKCYRPLETGKNNKKKR